MYYVLHHTYKGAIIFTAVGNKELLSKKVASEIEEAIINKKLIAGDKLPTEFELCDQFGVSRTAIREALRTLSAKGLISIQKGKGIFIEGYSSDSIIEPMHRYLQLKGTRNYIFEVIHARRIIEPGLAAHAAINRTEEHIEKLQKDVAEMRKFNGSPEDFAKLDMAFHMDIAVASGNSIMPLILKPIHLLMPDIKAKILSTVPGATESKVGTHPDILEAIINKDGNLAYRLMEEHLEGALKHAETMIRIEAGLKEPDND